MFKHEGCFFFHNILSKAIHDWNQGMLSTYIHVLSFCYLYLPAPVCYCCYQFLFIYMYLVLWTDSNKVSQLLVYREAVEHLLIALNQQAAGRGLQGEKSLTFSDTIWSTLRLVITLMQRSDLVPIVNDRFVILDWLQYKFELIQ